MTNVAPGYPVQQPQQGGSGWSPHANFAPSMYRERSSNGLLFAGIAVIALGAVAWHYLGPDFRRYMKIRDM